MKKTDVCTFGEILIDFTQEGINEGGTPLFAAHPGGAPANVSVGVSRLGRNSAFIGKTGTDMHGKTLKSVLEENGVETRGMIADPDVFTTLAFVSVNEDGEREFSFARKPGADTQIQWEEMDQELIENSRIFHIGSLSLTDEPARSACLQAVRHAREHGVMVSYDPNYRASLWPNEEQAIEQMRSLIPYADIMKISDEETALLTGLEDPREAARSLIEQGVKVAAVTLGSEGALVANQQGMYKVAGYASKVADTNGAGDSFWATMLAQIAGSGKKAEELSLVELSQFVSFANAAAALTVRRHGAIPAMPSLREVEAFLDGEAEY